jgi:hypothetical protein
VVQVSATKKNAIEEAKWFIDVAISLMRLSARHWKGVFPDIGKIEPHPTYPTNLMHPRATIAGDVASLGGMTLPPWYEIDEGIASALNAPEIQARAKVLFDPSNGSLAQRVAQGLGWMTRGRQVSDRSERLLSFFTALEALLTTSDKSDPITQTISRNVSVIWTQDVKKRVEVFNRIKNYYSIRSSVVHSGRREVLWQDVNNLQNFVEGVFWVVLNQCDLTMSQERFAKSLAYASHGLRWEFAEPEEPYEAANDAS